MYETIVLTLDGSELAEAALPYAEELMGRLRCRLVVLHVCDSSKRDRRRGYFDLLELRIRQKLSKSDNLTGLAIKTIFLEGNPAAEIIDFVERNSIDLTIMATHGRSGVGRWAMGSVADKVLRRVTHPLTLIRAGVNGGGRCFSGKLFDRILAPLDGSKTGEAALPYVKELALRLQSEVILFHAVAEEEYPEEINWIDLRDIANAGARSCLVNAGQWLKTAGINVRYEVKFGDPAEHIVDMAGVTGADIVAMSTHGRSGIDRMFFGSVAEKVLQGGAAPLLLVRATAD